MTLSFRFSGIGIEVGNLSGHRTLITFCKLIANYMFIAHTFSRLFSQHGQEKCNFESGKSQGIFKASKSGNSANTAGYPPVVRGWAGRQGRVVPQELGVEGGVAVADGPGVRPAAATTDLLGEPVGVAPA